MSHSEEAQSTNSAFKSNSNDNKEGFQGVTMESKPRVTFPTPDQDNDHSRSAKRLKTESLPVNIDSSEYKQTEGQTHSQAWMNAVAKQLLHWVQGCVVINEKCKSIPPFVVTKLALAILRQTINNNECDNSPLRVYNLHALCAASLWIAIKFTAPRDSMPGTTFMSMVASINKKLLREAELHVLECINWDVYALAKRFKLCTEETTI